jgi:hypothetical protein
MPNVNTPIANTACRQRRIVWRRKDEPFLTGVLSLIARRRSLQRHIQYRAPPSINPAGGRIFCGDGNMRHTADADAADRPLAAGPPVQ